MQYRMNFVLVVLAAIAVLVGTTGVAQAGLIAHWAFDEAVGASTAVDETGNHSGAIDTTSAIKPTTGETFAKIGKSYFFEGAADPLCYGGVEVPHASDIDTFTNATFCGWLYVDNENVHLYKPLFSKWTPTAESYNLRVYMEYNTFETRFRTPSTLQSGYNDDHVITDNAWHQVTVTYAGPAYGGPAGTANSVLYVDGVQIDSATLTGQAGIAPTNDPLWLGTYGQKSGSSVACFDGWLDDLGIWGETLTDGKANSLYTVVNDLGLAYDLSNMKLLFDVFDTGTPDTIGGLDWVKDTDLPTPPGVDPEVGRAWSDGSNYYVWLADGSYEGVKAVIPEPSTLLLLTTGLLGLLAYAWRKRK